MRIPSAIITGRSSLLFLLAALLVTGGHTARAVETIRIRVAWGIDSEGKGAVKAWRGNIGVSKGTVSDPKVLGMEADEPGSMWVEDGRLVIQQRGPRDYDGVDFLITAELDAKLIIKLAPLGAPDPGQGIKIKLTDLLTGHHSNRLDNNNKLLVRRTPGDKLRVQIARPHLVFSPGEAFRLKIQPHLLSPAAGNNVDISCALKSARGSQTWWQGEKQVNLKQPGGASPSVSLKVMLPQEEGVYDLAIAAVQRRRGLGGLANRNIVLAERKVQVIVLAQAPMRVDNPKPPATEIQEISPHKRWWEKMAQLPQIPGWKQGPLEGGNVGTWNHPQLGPMFELGPVLAGRDPSWHAFALSLSQPGQPHILEVEYPSDMAQTLGISVLEPNAAGKLFPVGLDSGIHVTRSAERIELASHRLTFWPRTKTPLVLLTNLRRHGRAVHGKIRVTGPKSPGMQRLIGASETCNLPPAFSPELSGDGRLVAGYYHRPLFPENFLASQAFDSWSGRSLDDWVTLYEGSTRLVEYLRHTGHNGLFISVLAAGSTIYPSRLLEPTPRYDTGTFFSSGQDPIRKDALEMLFRMFDRQNMKLIPVLQFDTPLPNLEATLRRGGADSAGIRLIGPKGYTWIQTHGTRRGLAPYYNPLCSRVQDEMLAVADEVIERYRHHPSFAGLAVSLSGNGYAQLPGPDWGYDDDTVARFARDKKIEVPAQGADRFTQRAEVLGWKNRQVWLAWRAGVLQSFYSRMAEHLQAARGGAKLYLAGTDMLDSPDMIQMLRPALPDYFKPEDILLTTGIQPDLYRDSEGIVLLRPRSLAAGASLSKSTVELALDGAPDLDRLFAAQKTSGNLFLHQPDKIRLASFDAASPFGKNSTYTWLVSQVSPAGWRNRQRFVHALAAVDSQLLVDGGWMLLLGQEDSLRDLIATYRRLPAAKFKTIAGNTLPVTIRTLSRNGNTHIYMVNDSPWETNVSMRLGPTTVTELEELSGMRSVPSPREGRWTVKLRPFDLLAVRFAKPDVVVSEPVVTLLDRVAVELGQRMLDLVNRAATLRQIRRQVNRSAFHQAVPFPAMSNPGFEMLDAGGTIPGWFLAGTPGGRADPDAAEKFQGLRSVRLSTSGGAAALVSEPFDAPKTGRISVSVQLKKRDRQKQVPLRLALGGKLNGKQYHRFANVPITDQWEAYIFQIDDLPLAGLSELRVHFELAGPGEVWIDDVVLLHLVFNDNELNELSKILSLANFLRDNRQLAECARVLDGYWPRFLTENVPLPLANVAQVPAPQPAEQPSLVEETESSEGWRRFVPKFLR